MTRDDEQTLNQRLQRESSLIYDAYTALWRIQLERDKAVAQSASNRRQYEKTQVDQYLGRFFLGAGAILLLFGFAGALSSYIEMPLKAKEQFASGLGGLLLCFGLFAGAVACGVCGIMKWKEPEP